MYQGGCLGFAFWTHSGEGDMLHTLPETDIKALYELGPTGNILTDFSSDLSGWWAMGNQDSLVTGNSGGSPAAADTSTTVYDRSRASSTTNGTYNGGSAPVVLNTITNDMVDGGAATFRDTSSANSIHHALVSGSGVHHSKAVTLKSDGTNGTSTTDHLGNTIFWAGSNSTVTLANSSSFNYGNTAMAFDDGNILTVADHADFVFQADGMTIDGWAYINDVSDSGGGTTVNHFVSEISSGQGSYFHIRHDKNYG